MTALKLSGSDVIFLQETHLYRQELIDKCTAEWPGKSYWSLSEPRSCGIAILFSPKLEITIEAVHFKNAGRSLTIDSVINLCKVRFICIYGYNDHTKGNVLINSLTDEVITERFVILGGDFNFVEDPVLDKSSGEDKYGASSRPIMASFPRPIISS